MATPITIGSAGGEYMEAVVVLEWAANIGDGVKEGDLIVTVETAKAATEVEAPCDGILSAVFAEVGSEVPVTEVLGLIGVDLQDIDGADTGQVEGNAKVAPALDMENIAEPVDSAPLDTGSRVVSSPAARRAAVKADLDLHTIAVSSPTGRIKLRDLERTKPNSDVRSSPLARRVASNAGMDIASIDGTGPRGRVVKADVEMALTKPAIPAPAASLNTSTAVFEDGTFEIIPADGMRKTVAARLTEAKRDIPHFYLTADVRLDAMLKTRTDINAKAPRDADGKPAFKISVNDFIVKAWALALQQVPQANATWAGDAILLHKYSDVAVAVAIPGGLFTPIIRKAESKNLRQISAEVKDFAERARARKLSPNEYTGGSSSVSNLGMYGVKHFTSIINPPHGTIISIGAGEERPYAEKGEVKFGTFMTVSVSCDHRSVDGALGAQLMAAFKELIEQPLLMLT